MASQPPSAQNYIGCRISLVSKSDIRYEGTLIDLNEGSISLGGVRSFGTEDRRADTFVAPRNDIYEYVVFKTPDIKDLFVSSAPRQHEMGSDPAILEVKGSVNTANMPSAVPSQVAYGAMPQSSLMGYPPPAAAPPVTNNTSLSLPPMGMAPPQAVPHPQPLYNVAPTAAPDLANRAAHPAASSTAAQAKEAMYSDPFALNPQTYLAMNQQRRQAQEEQQRDTAYQGETRTFERGRGGYENRRGGHVGYNGRGGGGQMPGYGGRGGAQQGAVRGGYGGAYGNRGGQGGYGQRGGYQPGGGLRNDYQSVQISGHQAPTGDRAVHRAPPAQGTGAPRSLPEFDFDSANMAFQEIEERMRHVNVHDNAGAHEADEHPPEEEPVQDENKEAEPGKTTYDPTRSFFDNISCDALEKSKGPNNRPDWRRERQTNVETFGSSGPNSRVYENQNRGRGGYGSRGGGGGYYRGGYQGYEGGYGGRGGYGYQYQRGGRGGQGQRFNGYQARGGGAYSQA